MTAFPTPEDSPAAHVAFVINNYPPKAGGVEFHVAALAGALTRSGVKVTVFTLDRHPGETTEAGVQVIRIRSTKMIANVLSFPYPGTRKLIQKRIQESGVDVISVHTRFFPMTYLGVRVAQALKIPAVLTEHGSDHVRGVSPAIGLASRVVDFTLGRYALRKSSQVLAISEASQSFVWKLAKVPSQVFRNAIDVRRFADKNTAPPSIKRIVFLGRLVPGKGWKRVLDVAEYLDSQGYDFKVDFIGDGPDYQALESAVSASDVSSRVTLHGRLSLDEIATCLQGGVLLNPTELAEGFQTTLLEAIACQAAVVSTPVAAARYLKGLGAPIDIVDPEDTAGWNERTRDLLEMQDFGSSVELLSQFDWEVRGREYTDIVNAVTTNEMK